MYNIRSRFDILVLLCVWRKKMKLNNVAARYQRAHELGSVLCIPNLVCLSVCSDDIVERLDSSMNHIMPNFDII